MTSETLHTQTYVHIMVHKNSCAPKHNVLRGLKVHINVHIMDHNNHCVTLTIQQQTIVV